MFRFGLSILFFYMLSFSTIAQKEEQTTKSQIYVFVHGAWGGGWDYKVMESLLEAQGHKVYRVTLTGLGEKAHLNSPDVNLDTHVMDVVNLFKFEQLKSAVLIGHSYGGMVITGVADKIPNQISHLVYADAMLPVNGESAFDLMPEFRDSWKKMAIDNGYGWKIPPFWADWGLDVPHPLATFEQKIVLNNSASNLVPASYILTIEPGAQVDSFSRHADRAKKRGWPFFELKTGHNLQRTMPNEFAAILLELPLN